MAYAPPAFPLYASDFIMGTLAFTNEETGAYLRCLLYQWQCDGVPADDLRALSKIVSDSREKTKKIWRRIGTKFVRDRDGLYRNRRLEVERRNQLAFSGLQAEKGKKGGRASAAKRQAGAAP